MNDCLVGKYKLPYKRRISFIPPNYSIKGNTLAFARDKHA